MLTALHIRRKNAIERLTRELREAVMQFHDNVVRNVRSQWAQMDEVGCFCYAKDKNLPDEMRGRLCYCGAVKGRGPSVTTVKSAGGWSAR